MTTITQESNDSSNNKLKLSRENIEKMSNFIKLSDCDTDNKLDLFSYINCSIRYTIFKNCRGVVFNNEDIVLYGFPYTEEYVVGDKNNDMLIEQFNNLNNFEYITYIKHYLDCLF